MNVFKPQIKITHNTDCLNYKYFKLYQLYDILDLILNVEEYVNKQFSKFISENKFVIRKIVFD